MGFLYQVLKDVSEKQPYETGKEYLNTLVSSTLKSNLNSGHDGFCKAFPMVTVNVNRYNQAVKSSNENIKKKMEKLQTEMKLFTKGALKGILPKADENDFHKVVQAVDAVNRELDSCKNYAKFFTDALNIDDKSVNDAVDEFHSPLSVRVKDALRTVKQESERLGKLSERQQGTLKETDEKIKQTLSTLKVSVDCKIGDDVRVFVDELKKKVKPIKKHLDDITTELSQYVIELQTWINETKKYINEIRDTDVKRIVNETTDSLTGKTNLIADQATELLKWKERLNTQIEVIKSSVKEKVVEVQGAIASLGRQFHDGISEVPNSIEKIMTHIKGKVDTIEGYVGESKLGAIRGSDISIQQNWDALKDKITRLVGDIYEESSTGKMNYLGKVDKGLKAYAALFNDAKGANVLEKTVGGWVAEIVKSEAVKGLLKEYVRQNEEYRYFTGSLSVRGTDAMRDCVIPILKEQITEHLKDIQPETSYYSIPSTVEDKLSYVKKYLTRLSEEVMGKQGDVVSQVSESVKLQRELVPYNGGGTYKPYFLTFAVHAALSALKHTAERLAEQLESFATKDTNLGTNLPAAIKQVELIGQQFDGKTQKTFGASITKALEDVRREIKKLNGQFEQALQNGTTDSTTIAAYVDKYVEAIDTYANSIDLGYIATGLSDLSSGIQSNLTALSGAVKETTNIVNAKLENFIDMRIGKPVIRGEAKADTLQAIYDKLDKLQKGPVSEAVKLTNALLDQYLAAAEKHYTKQLTEYVDSQVKDATKQLTTYVYKQYIGTVKLQLEQFSDKVTQQLKGLPGDISRDLTLGFKGFMASFEKNFITDSRSVSGIRHINPKLTSPKESPLSKAADMVNYSFGSFFVHLENQEDFKRDFSKLQAFKKSLTKLLSGLLKSLHFDHTFSTNLDALNNAVTSFKPATYGDAKCPSLLNALKAGFTPLVEELKKAYVSTYSLRTIEWEKLTEAESRNYAKICWTITPILYQELTAFKYHLDIDGWTTHKIYHPADSTSSLHALFFRDNGYDVHRPENAEHGELNHKRDFNGSSILKHLTNETHNLFSQLSSPVTGIPQSTSGSDELGVTVAEESGLIRKLYDFLQTYFSVCHLTLIDKPRAPCSVYEILVWCNGLQFNPVYEKLKAQIKSEFMKEDKLNPGTKKLQPFEAHPYPVKYGEVEAELYKVSANSHAVLTAILGHGHKDGIYACEFSDNSLKLDYPSNMIQLLCMLFDLLKRLYHQLYFLLQQCQLTTQLSGWRDCHYGMYIGGSGWQCNTKQCPKQDCDQRHDQSGNQTGEQFPNCGVKSPLQSFLEDGLKGHLPHSVTARGSSLSCGTCGSTPGMPCRTPMGFADISAIASHTMIGQNIREVLEAYCGRPNSPLTRLCSQLNCLLPSAPKTLGDMFSFYYHLTDRWGMHGNEHKSNAFDAIVKAANFGRTYDELKVYHIFTPSHSALKKGHSDGSLGSLVCLSRDSVVCGPYLRPITHAIYETFSSKHADKYLSWIVYLTASFYDLLKKLYDECNSKCGSRGTNCHEKACIKECPTTSKQDPPRYHHRDCKSIVSCNNTLPTLAKYGFVLGDPERLNGSAGIEKKRTCRDLCTVFAEAFEEDSHLVQFFKAIDKFMFTIRAPFLWMTVALWSLSLFYLTCVMVGRLDVLHIRSHLRIPSSHKITAQSLLAAAQVGRLAKISYLQP
ncbi:hypothetical protein, conserved [Babesia bigemina]|uniref:C3H1-type domain-containing protein n=1 Tax=Babesia bigemina TaxID=5866 RepID=A0A061BKH9_BABBI|nr:hypothetical protein, conserved [Babesia bigemina]CDR71942.1 hypothetical protein, conserved [Babesia bigemina]|eukprot:XP_012770884.1 hypothetical protein, conserved [Babesia bigemina]